MEEQMSEEFLESILEHKIDLKRKAMQLHKGDESDADDLIQDTIIRALQNEDKFEKGTNLKGWLLTILYHQFVNTHRRQKKFGEICDKHESYTNTVSQRKAYTIEPLNSMELDSLLNLLHENLDEIFYEVLKKVDVEGDSYKETASSLDIPVGTVMSRLYRARRKARSVLTSIYDNDILEQYVDKDML